jgi:ankyrin repeat protein
LQIAAAGGHTETVSILLEKGANVNVAGGRDGSSLQIAAARGHTEIISILLKKGAKVNTAGGEHRSSLQVEESGTSLETASVYGHMNIIHVQEGPNVNVQGGWDKLGK